MIKQLLNQMKKTWVLFVLVVLLAGCSGKPTGDTANSNSQSQSPSNRVVAVSYALQYLTERIAGDDITVDFPAAGSQDPAHWTPDVDAVSSMQKADLIVTNGPGAVYAEWLERVTLDESKICRSVSDFAIEDYMPINDHEVVHSHGPEGEHSHPYFVPYTWLDPSLAIRQSKSIAAALLEIYPGKKDEIEKNLSQLVLDLEEIVNDLAEIEREAIAMISLNPQMKFLTRAAGIEDKHLLVFDKDSESSDAEIRKQLSELSENGDCEQLLCNFSPTENVQQIATDLGLELLIVELLEFEPAKGDFLQALKNNYSKLAK